MHMFLFFCSTSHTTPNTFTCNKYRKENKWPKSVLIETQQPMWHNTTDGHNYTSYTPGSVYLCLCTCVCKLKCERCVLIIKYMHNRRKKSCVSVWRSQWKRNVSKCLRNKFSSRKLYTLWYWPIFIASNISIFILLLCQWFCSCVFFLAMNRIVAYSYFLPLVRRNIL